MSSSQTAPQPASPPAAADDDGWRRAYSTALAGSTILDDPVELDEEAIFQWLKAHQLPHFAPTRPHEKSHHYILGNAPLPQYWLTQRVHFANVEEARTFLRPLHRNHAAMNVLTEMLYRVDGTRPVGETIEATLDRVARLLLSERVWIMPLQKPAPPDVGKTDPAVYAALNLKYRTKLDIGQLSTWEGGQYLRGYVPFTTEKDSAGVRHSVVAGLSGMTIATGFDLGQHTAGQLQAIEALSRKGLKAILPFAGQHFPGLGKPAVVAKVARLAPVPIIDKTDADVLDGVAGDDTLTPTVAAWNAHRKANVPTFQSLPSAWQTVMFSRTYNQGPGWVRGHSPTRGFFTAATQGKWRDAVKALHDAPVTAHWFKVRVQSEAAYLTTDMPPPIPAPAQAHPPQPGSAHPRP